MSVIKSNKRAKKEVPAPDTDWSGDLCLENHGGGCCGRFHMFAFDEVNIWDDDAPSFRDKVAGLREVLRESYGEGDIAPGRGYCIEVVLNEHQLKAWSRSLTTVGFKRVFSFCNANSGNNCYVYLLDTSKMK
jgi:hypothetical protein